MMQNKLHLHWLRLPAYLLLLWLLVACAPTILPSSSPLGQPPTENLAVLNVRQGLTQQLHADLTNVEVVSVEEKMWPDGCLGAPHADELCLQAQTPGYRLTFRVHGNDDYVYHTNQDGSSLRLVAAPDAAFGEPILTWLGSDEIGCQTIEASPDGVAFGPCAGLLMSVPYGLATRQPDLAEFASRYQSFTAETPAGTVDFVGQGTTVATPAEQRMIAAWARLLYWEAQGGRSGASWGLVFAWHRQGGIVGFCDDVTVHLSGEAYVTSCKGNQPEELGRVRLDAAQLATIYNWVDTLQSFESEQRDAAAADSMAIRIVFSGAGTTSVAEVDQQAITDLAQTLIGQVNQSAAGGDGTGESTVETLTYFSPEGGFAIRYPATATSMENVRPSVDGALAQAANTVAFVNGSPNYVLTITWFDLADRTVLRPFIDAYSECAAIVGTEGQPLDIGGHAALLFPEAPCGPFTTTYIFTVVELRGYRISIETMNFYTDVQDAVEAVVTTLQFQPPALPGDEFALCPVLAEMMQTFVNKQEGYCLLYPMDYVAINTGARAVEIVRYSLLNPVDPRVSIVVEDVDGRTLEEVAAQLETDYALPDMPVERHIITMDGVPGVMLDNLFGQDLNRRVAFIYDDRLFSLFFTPLGEPGADRAAMEAFYQDVLGSWRFLDRGVDGGGTHTGEDTGSDTNDNTNGDISGDGSGNTPIHATGEAIVESIEIRILASEPLQVEAVVRGQLPDACAFIERTSVIAESTTFRIRMTTAHQPNQRCAPMPTPFEEVILLGSPQPPTGTYDVRINDLVETFSLGD